ALPQTRPTNIRVGMIRCPISRSFTTISCHDRPYRSCVQPYRSLNGYRPRSTSTKPPSERAVHKASTSFAVVQATRNDTDGLNLNSGPAEIRVNSWPHSSTVTTSTDPDGV